MFFSGCVTQPPERWELTAVRVEQYQRMAMHLSMATGPHESYDHIVGTVVSDGPYRDQRMEFSCASAKELEPGRIYVVKLFTHLNRATRHGSNPPEWVIAKVLPTPTEAAHGSAR